VSGVEAVADSTQRLQVTGTSRIWLDFLPQAPHKNVNGSRGYERSFFPDCVEQLIARKDAPAVPHQVFKETELADRR
jgi:hypothetical protein